MESLLVAGNELRYSDEPNRRRLRPHSPARDFASRSHDAADLVASKSSLPHSPPRHAHLRHLGVRLGESVAPTAFPEDDGHARDETFTVKEKSDAEQ